LLRPLETWISRGTALQADPAKPLDYDFPGGLSGSRPDSACSVMSEFVFHAKSVEGLETISQQQRFFCQQDVAR